MCDRTVTPSLILKKLSVYGQQNSPAAALREVGRIERTLFTLRWFEDPTLRRTVTAELNKGEARNSLARAVAFHRLGRFRDRGLENQETRATALNLVTAATILLDCRYLGRAVDETSRRGTRIDPAMLPRLSPLGWDRINLAGDYVWSDRLDPDAKGLMTRTTFTRRSFALTLVATIATGGGAYLLRRSAVSSPGEVAARAAAIGRANGLRIDYGNPASFYLPPYGPRDAIIPDGKSTQAEVADVAAALDGIEQSLAVYPPGFYAGLAKAIFICGTLRFGDERAGGTYGPAWIIIAADPSVGSDGICETAGLGVHHEFSSLLLQRQPGVQAQWQALLPAGWRSQQRSDEALRQKGDGSVSDGFLSAYAATSLENDFNTYAETAFGNPNRLIALAADNTLVRQKAGLLLQAYAARDARMEQTFRNLRLAKLAAVVPAMPADLRIAPGRMPTPTIGAAN